MIRHFVEESAQQELIDVKEQLAEILSTIKSVNGQKATIDLKVNDLQGVKDAIATLKTVGDLQNTLTNTAKSVNALSSSIQKFEAAQAKSSDTATKLAVNEEKVAQAKAKTAIATAQQQKAEEQLQQTRERGNKTAETTNKLSAEQQQQRRLEIAGNKEAVSIQRELERQNKAASVAAQEQRKIEMAGAKEALAIQKEVEKQNKANAAADALVERELEAMTNDYKLLSKAYTDAANKAKEYGATLGLNNPVFIEAASVAKRMQERLSAIDAAVGQYGRNVGNYKSAYNGLAASFNQLTRELPALAINANTFFLAISNNIPIFIDEMKRATEGVRIARAEAQASAAAAYEQALATQLAAGAAREQAVAEATLAKEQALANATREQSLTTWGLLSKAIFSWQTLLSVGVALFTIFGGKIFEIIGGLSKSEEAQKKYNDELKNSITQIAKQSAELTVNKSILNDSTAATNDKEVALENLKSKYPGYFESLTTEVSLLGDVNAAIDKQLGLLIAQAEAKANTKVLEDAQANLIQKVEDSQAPISRLSALWAGYAQVFRTSAENMKLSKEQQEKYTYLLENVSRGAAYVYLQRIRDIREAQEQLTTATTYAIKPNQQRIDQQRENIAVLEKEISEIQEHKMVGYELTNYWKAEIKTRQNRINTINETIAALEREQEVLLRQPKYTLDRDAFSLLVIKNRTLAFKKGTSERLQSSKDEIDQQLVIDRKQLADDYRKNDALYYLNQEYVQKDLFLQRTAAQAKEDLDDSFAKKHKEKKQKQNTDLTNEYISARQKEFEAGQELSKEQLEQDIALNQRRYEDDRNNIALRLVAYDKFIEDKQKLVDLEYETEAHERKLQLDKIAEIEKKALAENPTLDIRNQHQVENLKTVDDEQKKLLLRKYEFQAEERVAEEKHQAELNTIFQDAYKGRQKVVEDSLRQQVQIERAAYNALQDEAQKETAIAIADLSKRRDEGLISERDFWMERSAIVASQSELLYQKEAEYLNKRKQEIVKQLSDPLVSDTQRKEYQRVFDSLNELFGQLQISRPQPRKTESKSFLEYLMPGLSPSQVQKDLDSAKVSLDLAGKGVTTAQENFALAYANAAELAGEQFEQGSDDYNNFIADATKSQAAALEQAKVVSNAATQSFVEAQAKQREAAKAAIADNLNKLKASLDQLFSNIYQGKIDALDEQKQAIEDNLQEELLANETSLKSKKEKADEEARLRSRAAADEKRIEDQKKQLARQQAQDKKSQAIFEIAINAAVAESNVIKSLTGLSGFGLALGIAQAATIAALAVAQIAAVSAQPIPGYWEGTEKSGGHKGGLAFVGERGTELVRIGDKSYLTPAQATLVDLPKDAEVIPNHELAKATEFMQLVEIQSIKSQVANNDNLFMAMYINKAIAGNMKLVSDAIRDQQHNHFEIDRLGNFRKSTLKGNSWTNHISHVV